MTLASVCAKRMFITDEIVTEPMERSTQLERMLSLFEPIMDGGAYYDSKQPCQFLCSDQCFYPLSNVTDKASIIGIITDIHMYRSDITQEPTCCCHVLYLDGKCKAFDYVEEEEKCRVIERKESSCA